jgi:hypothetical protein
VPRVHRCLLKNSCSDKVIHHSWTLMFYSITPWLPRSCPLLETLDNLFHSACLCVCVCVCVCVFVCVCVYVLHIRLDTHTQAMPLGPCIINNDFNHMPDPSTCQPSTVTTSSPPRQLGAKGWRDGRAEHWPMRLHHQVPLTTLSRSRRGSWRGIWWWRRRGGAP